MQILRTIVWVVLVVALAFFAAFNWQSVAVRIWDNLILETRLPVLIATAFLIGLVPTWLYHRTAKWRLQRRIASLEAAQRSLAAHVEVAVPPASSEPVSAPAEPAARTL